jgi:membrane-associated phospholipid phosphatase
MDFPAIIRNTRFFLLPFFMWVVAGGVLLLMYPAAELFFAINSRHCTAADLFFPLITHMGEFVGILSFGLLLMLFFRPYRSLTFFVCAVLGTLIPSLLSQLVKHIVNAPRPMSFFAGSADLHHLPSWQLLYQNSFPSGHATGAFAFMAVVAFHLPVKFRGLGFLCFLLAFFAAYSRVYLTAHFFADIYSGSIIGTLAALTVCGTYMFYSERYKSRN